MNAPAGRDAPWRPEYEALVRGVGLVDLGHRTQILVNGEDRARFLHNLTTNEIRKLAPGSGCEAFLTTAQGKTLARVFIFVLPESLVIDTVPQQADVILKHLDHYLISERVTLADRSNDWSELLLAGPDCQRLLTEATGMQPPAERLAHAPAHVAGRTVFLRRADLVGPAGFLITGRNDDVAAARQGLRDAAAVPCCHEAFEAARIEWGFPLFGVDIADSNLPQEVARDAQAISFVKGCYLGQETVARIDALGHVNKSLVGVRLCGTEIPVAGSRLSAAGRHVGELTSAAFSPALAAPLALAYVRRGSNTPGTRLDGAAGAAEVVALPVR